MDGFGKMIAQSGPTAALRSKLLASGSLVSWPSAKVVGVCKNKEAQRLNAELLQHVAHFWCPQWQSPAMIPLDDIKKEVFGWKCSCHFMC